MLPKRREEEGLLSASRNDGLPGRGRGCMEMGGLDPAAGVPMIRKIHLQLGWP